jgi:hypothetical protein
MRFATIAMLASLGAMIAAPALALGFQTRSPVFQSGGVYHAATCPGPAAPGFRRCFAHVVTDNAGRPIPDRFQANRIERHATANLVPGGFGPTSLISAYNPSVKAKYPTGVGAPTTIIAAADAYGYANAEHDLGVYRATYGLPACTTANGCFLKYNQSGQTSNYPKENLGWAQETALDLDMLSAMCPNCKIMLVEATSESNHDLALAVATAVQKGAKVVSNSYGSPEEGPAIDWATHYHQPGAILTASTGDNGYAEGPEFPATSPYVTAVGGTSLKTATTARGWSESAWLDGGSGCSQFYPKPKWQSAITLCTMRMEADVSAVADPNTGVAVYGPLKTNDPHWMIFGGTSASAPIVAGLYGANGRTFVVGSEYGATVNLNDVITGHNGSCGGTYFCTAGKGYDGPTGLGTPSSEHGF